MRNVMICAAGLALSMAVAGCSREPEALQIPTGSEVTLEKKDGVTVSGRLVEVGAQEVVLERRDGRTTRVSKSEIAGLRTTALGPDAASPETSRAGSAPRGAAASSSSADAPREKAPTVEAPVFTDHQVPAGIALPIELRTSLASDTNQVEDEVRGRLTRAITVNGVDVVPAGATVLGTVTEVERSARVKGRARLAFRFSVLEHPETGSRVSIRTSPVVREAEGTKKKDAAKIGGGAAGGAIIGGILSGGDGAAKGAAIGGAAGTGVVLSTRGEEVRLAVGTPVSATLTAPFIVRLPEK